MLDLQIAERESEEQREGERLESSNEQRVEAGERRLASGRVLAASEREKEQWLASGRQSGGRQVGERVSETERRVGLWERD